MLQRGDCTAIVEIEPNAKAESLEHCDSLYLAPNIEIEPVHDYQLMRDDDLDAWREVSEAILEVLATRAYNRMLVDNMRYDQTCTTTAHNNNSGTNDRRDGSGSGKDNGRDRDVVRNEHHQGSGYGSG